MSLKIEIPSYTESEIKEEPWIELVELKLWAIIASVVESPSTDISEAAKQLNALFPTNRCPELNFEDEQLDGFLREFWDIFRMVAAQIPAYHAALERLIELIKALCDLPPIDIEWKVNNSYYTDADSQSEDDDLSDSTDSEGEDDDSSDSESEDEDEIESKDHIPPTKSKFVEVWNVRKQKLWSDLPDIGTVLSEAPYIDDSIGVEEFIARLVAAGLVKDYWWVALSTFNEALEQTPPIPDRTPAPTIDELLPKVGLWIRIAGVQLYEACLKGELKEHWYQLRGWGGECGLSKERWEYWKKRLGEISVNELPFQETKETAKMAKMIMEEIDGTTV